MALEYAAFIYVRAACSLPLWAAAHAAVHGPDNVGGAARVLGVDPANAMRKLTRAADRAFKPLR